MEPNKLQLEAISAADAYVNKVHHPEAGILWQGFIAAYIAGAQSRDKEIKELMDLLEKCLEKTNPYFDYVITGELRENIKQSLKRNNDGK